MNQLKIDFLWWHPVYKEYGCDKEGDVLSMKSGQIKKLKPSKNKQGYLQVWLCKNGKVKKYRVNRFVWECIKGEIPEGWHIDHLDFNRLNNCIENLLARPAAENITRLSEEGMKVLCKPVIQNDTEGHFVAYYPSIMEAERKTGIPNQSISECCRGKRKSAGGSRWVYA